MTALQATEQTTQTTTPASLHEVEELASQIGEFIHYWGFKRVHGRIWSHLFLAKEPLDAAQLVARMSISKALISISLRELLEYEVVQEVGKSARGTLLYRTNPDILSVILSVLRQRERRMFSRMTAAHDALAKISAGEREKFGLSEKHTEQLGALIGKAQGALENVISLQSVDLGDLRQEFLTVDLEEENELRQKSIVAPPSKERPSVHFAPRGIDDESEQVRESDAVPSIDLASSADHRVDHDVVILPGAARF